MSRRLSKEEWRRRRRRKHIAAMTLIIALMVVIIAFSALFIKEILKSHFSTNISRNETIMQTLPNGEDIQIRYLTPNPYSRPQTKLKKIKGIVIHYTANPGTSADNNRSYFEGLAEKQTTSASSHFIIGLEGEILQCIPLTEISYASNERNEDTISIECCHPDETGKFNDATYDSLVSLTAALCMEFDLRNKDVIRHYDVTEKLCPLYFVEHEDAWEAFREDVKAEVERLKLQAALPK
jgi:N-acetylmuramoyl-L-alanine amidase